MTDPATFLSNLGGQLGDFRRRLPDLRNRIGISGLVGFGFVLLLFMVVLAAAFEPLADETEAGLGTWQPFVEAQDINRALSVDFDKTQNWVQLVENRDFEAILSPTIQQYVRVHKNRFNRAVRGRTYDPSLVPRDVIFRVNPDVLNGAEQGHRIQVLSLSGHDTKPLSTHKKRSLGTVYLHPSATPIPYVSDGFIGLFLLPGQPTDELVSLKDTGLWSAGSFVLTDESGLSLASLEAAEDGAAVYVTPSGASVFINNNPARKSERVPVRAGQVVEVAGRFFEVRIEESPILAVSPDPRRPGRRIYPMGSHLHFVGPVSLNGTHQSLGIEYMFREYLQGNEARDIEPGAIWLTIQPGLQSMLTRAVVDMADKSKVNQASGLIMDARTGAILAMAAHQNDRFVYDPGNQDQVLELLDAGEDRYANHGCFKRHVIGSVTKPFFAFMALQLYPDVTEMRVRLPESLTITTNLFGHPLYGSTKGHGIKVPRHNINFQEYLTHSDNAYNHSLGFLLLAGAASLDEVASPWAVKGADGGIILKPVGPTGQLQLGGLGKDRAMRINGDAAFARTLRQVFELETTSGAGITDDRDLSIYGSLIDYATRILQKVNPGGDPAAQLLRRSAICAPETPRMELDEVTSTMQATNILFGANRNRWTDVKACESFSRLVTGRKVQARLVYKYLDTLAETPAEVILEKEAPFFETPSEVRDKQVFSEMRKQLEGVTRKGTAVLLHPMLEKIRQQPGMERFRLFGKTGTIDDDKPDSKLFLGSFGLWDEATDDFDGPAVTFIFYLKNSLDQDAVLNTILEELPLWWRELNPVASGMPPEE